MSRVKKAPASRKRRKKRIKLAKGYSGGRSNLYRSATQAVDRAGRDAYVARRKKKGDFRSLWITRIGAGAEKHGISYSKFIAGLKKAGVSLDRKILADLAVLHKGVFTELVKVAKKGSV
ncbi:MAG: 50S ribosomal protein L20 [Candidatus Tritonobacter lacicola]|nr:50S ribosomal protein L20 [Candidatus Tritonobacter lacicola]